MRWSWAPVAGVFLAAAVPLVALADENSDLDLIPNSVTSAPPTPVPNSPTASTYQGTLQLDDSVTLDFERSGLAVPVPPGQPEYWQDNPALDERGQWTLSNSLAATLSDQFDLYAGNNIPAPSRQEFRNDFREGYLTWQPVTQFFLEAGRVNLKEGVAAGFNPTDFFKTDSVVDDTTADPSALREGRLGTVMVHAQEITDAGSFELAFAPKLTSPPPLATDTLPSLDPEIDRTNPQDRFLASASLKPIGGVVPQALFYREAGGTRLGADLSDALGKSVVLYGEWSGGPQRDLIAESEAYGRATGTLPSYAPDLPSTDPGVAFRNDLALGGSWTGFGNLTVNLEYHYHQAGFSRADWHNWFALGSAQPSYDSVAGELWYVRGYAAAEEEPETRQEGFVRLAWTDAFIRHLDIAALSFVDLYDGSSRDQINASYDLSDNWTLAAQAGTTLGGKRSEYGSLPQATSLMASAARYF